MNKYLVRTLSNLTHLLLATICFGQTYDLSWHTVDGGGAMNSAGGAFVLAGTIGQPDAGPFAPPMTGGAFELVGGFWPVATPTCNCPGDMNADGLKNGRDINQF